MKTLFALMLSLAAFFPALVRAQAEPGSWKIVPNQEVCMVTDAHFMRPQIPVQVGKRTYYGCCENCKTTLQNDEKSRSAVDPVSKKPVDKAKAVIAANDQGTVLYFENKANFEKYAAGAKAK